MRSFLAKFLDIDEAWLSVEGPSGPKRTLLSKEELEAKKREEEESGPGNVRIISSDSYRNIRGKIGADQERKGNTGEAAKRAQREKEKFLKKHGAMIASLMPDHDKRFSHLATPQAVAPRLSFDNTVQDSIHVDHSALMQDANMFKGKKKKNTPSAAPTGTSNDDDGSNATSITPIPSTYSPPSYTTPSSSTASASPNYSSIVAPTYGESSSSYSYAASGVTHDDQSMLLEATALEDWVPTDTDSQYLSLRKGERILVYSGGESDGWLYGKNATSEEGYFPPTFVEMNSAGGRARRKSSHSRSKSVTPSRSVAPFKAINSSPSSSSNATPSPFGGRSNGGWKRPTTGTTSGASSLPKSQPKSVVNNTSVNTTSASGGPASKKSGKVANIAAMFGN